MKQYAQAELLQCLPPVFGPGARILVLGSMPGAASLAEQQYYAHSRNAFWAIMADIFGFDAKCAYQQRLQNLRQEGVALWDVMQFCHRRGSLDADIEEASIVPNDFENLLEQRSMLTNIFFNGAKAEQSFNRHVLPGLRAADTITEIPECVRLPSTSPAHAAMSVQEKTRIWKQAILTAL